ncbi:hypothetical protein ACIRPQ_34760 [Streptomyces sp. NPDC101213]|uniref:hypothetical protein n=1 Tax=Streptomyces sp. NPDC101213 TaxID=3366130 RepID=UPI00382F494C
MSDLAREVRSPDPYVWRLPDPHDARRRRWSKRSRATGRYLPFPRDETCWATTPPPVPPSWRTGETGETGETGKDLVRLYVLGP